MTTPYRLLRNFTTHRSLVDRVSELETEYQKVAKVRKALAGGYLNGNHIAMLNRALVEYSLLLSDLRAAINEEANK